jgi:hypothetical protein
MATASEREIAWEESAIQGLDVGGIMCSGSAMQGYWGKYHSVSLGKTLIP